MWIRSVGQRWSTSFLDGTFRKNCVLFLFPDLFFSRCDFYLFFLRTVLTRFSIRQASRLVCFLESARQALRMKIRCAFPLMVGFDRPAQSQCLRDFELPLDRLQRLLVTLAIFEISR